jgi:hypothetical protein
MIAIFKPANIRKLLPAALILMLAVPCLQAQKVTQIEILNADIIKTDKSLGPGAQKLLGNVMLKHEDAIRT